MKQKDTKWPGLKEVHTLVFDFDGVFTDNKVYVSADGRESVCCDRADGLGFDFLRRYKVEGRIHAEYFILSKETNPVVQARANKLQLDCFSSVVDKLDFLIKYLGNRFHHIKDPFTGLVYLGNDLNDLPIMERAGFSVAPNDAHDRVKEVADVVLSRNGGNGFVRFFLERWLGIDQLPLGAINGLFTPL